MLAAIDFDDQPSRGAKKIDDIGSDRHLAPKGSVLKPVRAQARPNPTLRVRHVTAKQARAGSLAIGNGSVRHAHLPPSRRPSAVDLPRKGGGKKVRPAQF
jgi:hypothetical protein